VRAYATSRAGGSAIADPVVDRVLVDAARVLSRKETGEA
jgi:hypothetical protein